MKPSFSKNTCNCFNWEKKTIKLGPIIRILNLSLKHMKKQNYYQRVVKPKKSLKKDWETMKWANNKKLTKKQLNRALDRALRGFATFDL